MTVRSSPALTTDIFLFLSLSHPLAYQSAGWLAGWLAGLLASCYPATAILRPLAVSYDMVRYNSRGPLMDDGPRPVARRPTRFDSTPAPRLFWGVNRRVVSVSVLACGPWCVAVSVGRSKYFQRVHRTPQYPNGPKRGPLLVGYEREARRPPRPKASPSPDD